MTIHVVADRPDAEPPENSELTLQLPSAGPPDRVERFRSRLQLLERLMPILLEFYYCSGPVFVLDAVAELAQAQVELTTLCDVSRLSVAEAQLADVLIDVFELNHDFLALDRAIKFYQHLLHHAQHPTLPILSLPNRHCYLEARLAYSLLCRCRCFEREEDFQSASEALLRARNLAHTINSVDQATAWIAVANGHRLLNIIALRMPNIPISSQSLADAAIDVKSSRNQMLPRSLYMRSLIVESDLCNQMDRNDINREAFLRSSISEMTTALGICSDGGDVLHYQILMQMGACHDHIRQHLKDHTDLATHMHTALGYWSQACALTDLMTRNRFERIVSLEKRSLAAAIVSVNYSQDLDSLEEAVDNMRQVVTMSSEIQIHSARYRRQFIKNLGFVLACCFEQTGRLAALDEMIDLCKSVGETTLTCQPPHARNLAEVLLTRASMVDSDTAKLMIKEAIQVCQMRKNFLKNAPDSLGSSFNDELELDAQLVIACRLQIQVGEQPLIDPHELIRLAQHYSGSIDRLQYFQRTLLVLAQTDMLMWQANMTSCANESKSGLLATGLSIVDQQLSSPDMASSNFVAELLGARADLIMMQSHLSDINRNDRVGEACHIYERATRDVSGRPSTRFQICLRWASRASEHGHWNSALKAYSRAIDILPDVIFLGENVAERIQALRSIGGLAVSSVTAALVAGDTTRAIDFLERSRGILWLQSSQPRSEQLETVPAALRHDFVRIVGELRDSDLNWTWTARRHKAEQLKGILSEIHQLPGLERFQRPPQLRDIQLALRLKRAYAVVLVPGGSHCDALILGMSTSNTDVCHIRIQGVTLDWTRCHSQDFQARCANARAAHDSTSAVRGVHQIPAASPVDADPLSPLLSELWITLVRPILEHMHIRKPDNLAERQRVYWCPTGALSSLPLHAAGIYDGLVQDHVGNHIISSYIPTLSALHHLLTEEHTQIYDSVTPTMLLLAQPTSLGLSPLANVQVEVNEIKASIAAEWTTSIHDGFDVTVDNAVDNIKSASMLHLACHGHQDQVDPLKSGFYLRDGRLTLGKLMGLNLPNAHLAYLSACDSAGIDESRPDEGLNLVGAMIFVGFRSVIGTMWAMDDLDGPFMARRIYSRIFKEGKLDLNRVPIAVDSAVRELRESGVPASRWATYVHFGV